MPAGTGRPSTAPLPDRTRLRSSPAIAEELCCRVQIGNRHSWSLGPRVIGRANSDTLRYACVPVDETRFDRLWGICSVLRVSLACAETAHVGATAFAIWALPNRTTPMATSRSSRSGCARTEARLRIRPRPSARHAAELLTKDAWRRAGIRGRVAPPIPAIYLRQPTWPRCARCRRGPTVRSHVWTCARSRSPPNSSAQFGPGQWRRRARSEAGCAPAVTLQLYTPARKEICERLSVWGMLGLLMNRRLTSPAAVTRISALPAVSSTALNSSVAAGR